MRGGGVILTNAFLAPEAAGGLGDGGGSPGAPSQSALSAATPADTFIQ